LDIGFGVSIFPILALTSWALVLEFPFFPFWRLPLEHWFWSFHVSHSGVYFLDTGVGVSIFPILAFTSWTLVCLLVCVCARMCVGVCVCLCFRAAVRQCVTGSPFQHRPETHASNPKKDSSHAGKTKAHNQGKRLLRQAGQNLAGTHAKPKRNTRAKDS
jgi:hypothetical protein